MAGRRDFLKVLRRLDGILAFHAQERQLVEAGRREYRERHHLELERRIFNAFRNSVYRNKPLLSTAYDVLGGHKEHPEITRKLYQRVHPEMKIEEIKFRDMKPHVHFSSFELPFWGFRRPHDPKIEDHIDVHTLLAEVATALELAELRRGTEGKAELPKGIRKKAPGVKHLDEFLRRSRNAGELINNTRKFINEILGYERQIGLPHVANAPNYDRLKERFRRR